MDEIQQRVYDEYPDIEDDIGEVPWRGPMEKILLPKMPKKTWGFIRGCLHPDREVTKEHRAKALDLLTRFFKENDLIGD